MNRVAIRVLGAPSAGLLALMGALLAGQSVGREPRAAAPPVIERTPFRRGDVTAPPWAPTAGWVLPFVGSLFRGRFSTARSPLDGVEAVLVTPRKRDECLDCPLGLRVIGGEPGAKTIAKILPSLDSDLSRLVESRGMPPAVGAWLRSAQAELALEAVQGLVDGGRPPTRALFIGMSRPNVAPSAWSVGLVMTDLPDPHFDRVMAGEARREGCRFRFRLQCRTPGSHRHALGRADRSRTIQPWASRRTHRSPPC